MEMPEPIVTAVVYYDKAPTLERVIQEGETKIWPYYRFSSTVENDTVFVPVLGGMDKSYHFKEVEVADEKDIDVYAQRIMAQPLSRTHPLWTVTVVKAKKGRSAMICRIHHCISDGLGLLFAFLPLMGCKDGDVLTKIPLPAMLLGKAAPPRKVSDSKPKIAHRKDNAIVSCMKGVKMFLKGVFSILIMKDDDEFKMNAPKSERRPFLQYSGKRAFVRMPCVPTATIKAVRAAHGCTFNDAIMAALTGALRRYSIEVLGEENLDGDRECKAFMLLGLPRPVDPKNPSVSLANNILTPVFRIPLGESTPIARLKRCVERCNDLKSMAYLTGIRLTTKIITMLAPTAVMKKLASECVSKCTMNITNVPLPDVPTTFFGEEMKEVQFLFVNAIPQVSMLSYNGQLHWNLVVDPDKFPNAAEFGTIFLKELEVLAKSN